MRVTAMILASALGAWAQENRKPEVDEGPTALPAPAFVGDSLAFAVKARDPDGGPLTFSWNFGDGSPATPYAAEAAAGHRFAAPGRYAVTVRIRDTVSAITASLLVPVHRKPAPGRPAASSPIVADSASGRVYAVNPDHGTFSAFDAGSLARLWEMPCGADPRSLALASDGTVWVANRGSATVTIHAAADGALLKTVKLPYGSRPHGLLIRPAGDHAFLALEGSGGLARLDVPGRALSGMLDLGPTPRALALAPDGVRLLITRFLSPADHAVVYEVDAARLAAGEPWILPRETTPDGETSGSGVPNYLAAIAIAPHGGEAVVAAKKDNTARGRLLDGRDLTFENTVRTTLIRLDLAKSAEVPEGRGDVDNAALPSAVLYSPLGDLNFVALEGSDRFEVHDPYNHGAVLERNPEAGSAPLGLALDAARGRLFVLGFLGRAVKAFDVREVLASRRFASVLLKSMPSAEREALPEAVIEGKRIFYRASDSAMSRDGYLACAVCHLDGGTDGRVWDFTDRGEGLRRTTSLLGRAGTGHGPVHWSANFDEIQDFEHDMRGPFGGRGFLDEGVFNQGTRNRTLGEPKAGLSPRLDALAAYVTSLSRVNASPFRRSDGSNSPEALAGRALFEREDVGCAKCHSGPALTDSRLPALGAIPAPGPVAVFAGAASWRTAEGFLVHDVGTLKPSSGRRLGDTLRGIDTPGLKGLWETAPYLHDGSAADLMAVLTAANPADRHGKTSHLTASEKASLVAYLRELDDGEETGAAGVRSGHPRVPAGPRLEISARAGALEIRLSTLAGGWPRLELLDSRGRLVHAFGKGDLRPLRAGVWATEWRGRGRDGHRVRPGVYHLAAWGRGWRVSSRLPLTGPY